MISWSQLFIAECLRGMCKLLWMLYELSIQLRLWSVSHTVFEVVCNSLFSRFKCVPCLVLFLLLWSDSAAQKLSKSCTVGRSHYSTLQHYNTERRPVWRPESVYIIIYVYNAPPIIGGGIKRWCCLTSVWRLSRTSWIFMAPTATGSKARWAPQA